jgi:hypothetical protein
MNDTRVPSALMPGVVLNPLDFGSGNPLPRLARIVLPAARSRTWTSDAASLSPLARLLALVANATRDPSASSTGRVEPLSARAPCAPSARLARYARPAARSRT